MPNFVKISCEIKKFSIQELEFDRSVCMTAISYSDPILTISSDINLRFWIIIHAKFREDIMSNKKVFHTRT